MAPSFRFGSLVLLAVPWLLVAGCGDDNTSGFANGGSSGQAGAGGAHAGNGGTGGGSNTVGGSSSGGTNANGGTNAGAAAGEGGAMSSAGAAGTTGGTGGAPSGGKGGTGGATGGTGGASSGGKGGTGGTGGASGGTGGATGGTGGATGGTGGKGGTGGTSGGTGGATGGTGGATGGTGGATGGTGGVSGGTGGATGGTGGVSGGTGGATGGTGGATGGTGGAGSAVKNCAYACTTDDDCKIDGEVPRIHFCNPIRKHCEDYSTYSACETQSDCAAFASFWSGPCNSDTDCTNVGDVCVAFGGRGACAPLADPDPDVGCSGALGPDAAPTQLARFGATGNVVVCQSPDGICVDKSCQFSCNSLFGGCDTDPQCNVDTGMCDCSGNDQCSTTAGRPVCGASSHCECASSDQCASITAAGFDTCYSGTCGCSSAAACEASPYPNAPAVCE